MDASSRLPSSSFGCEMRVIQAKNMEVLHPTCTYFVRFFLPAGDNRKIQLDTGEVPSQSDLGWDESFSLRCDGNGGSIEWLKHRTIIFELRCRYKAPVLGKFFRTSSKLLGRAEVPWKEVFASPHLEIETWGKMSPTDGHLHGCSKAPSVKIVMKLSVAGDEKDMRIKKKGRENARNHRECLCRDCNGYSCTSDYDVFALVAALDLF